MNSARELRAINGASNRTFCIASSARRHKGRYDIGRRVIRPGNNVTLIGVPVRRRPDGYGHRYRIKARSKIHGSGPAIIDLNRKHTITIRNLDLSGARGSCSSTHAGTIVTNGVNLKISNSRLHHGFAQAIGHSSGGTFRHLEVDHNGARCLRSHVAGGIKTGSSRGYTISRSFVHHNVGPGIWCDASCDNFRVVRNVSVRNSGQGIRYEHGSNAGQCSSCNARITYNIAKRNGLFTWDRNNMHAGIGISSSENALIAYNRLGGNYNSNGIMLQDGRHPLRNIRISNNALRGDRIKSCDKSGVICKNNRR
ncbi:MAG: right-handed parallel beta-helix repeat-containing protein [Actinomycetota bacterium]